MTNKEIVEQLGVSDNPVCIWCNEIYTRSYAYRRYGNYCSKICKKSARLKQEVVWQIKESIHEEGNNAKT